MHDGNASQNTLITTLGRYRIVQRIGKGGMGDVWLCEDPTLRRQVAIKTLPSHSQTDREFALRFEREAQAAAALNHPHILPVHDYGQQPMPNGQNITYIVMPYIPDGSLADRIASNNIHKVLTSAHNVIMYLVQAAEAIDYAHEQGLIHRDIKPANMLLRTDSWLLLADFGIARMLASSDNLTQTGVGFGTPHYMAPEQAQGKAEFASDNYSLAVIAYQLFVGRLPFDAETAYATTIQHMTLQPPQPRQFNPSLPPALESALLTGLAKEPDQRPPSARAFVDMLQQSLTNSATFAPTIVKTTPPPITDTVGAQNSSPQTITTQQSFPMQKTLLGQHQSKQPVASTADITRRRLLIGGGATFVVAGSGLGIWALIPKASQPPITSRPTTVPAAIPTDQPLVLRAHNKPVATLAWSPAGILASSGSSGDPHVFLWDVQTLYKQKASSPRPKATRQFDTGQDILLAWSPQGDMLAIANAENGPDLNSTKLDIYAGDLSGFAPGYNDTFIIKDNTAISALAWSPGENFITITNPGLSNINAKAILTVWNTKQPQQALARFNIPHHAYTDVDLTLVNTPLAIAAHTSPLTLALGTSDGISVEQIDLSAPQFKESYLFIYDNDKYTSGTKVVSWSSDGRYLAGIKDNYSKPTSVGIWDLQTRTIPPARVLPDDANTFLITMTWCSAPASTKIAAGGNNGKIYIWDSNGNTLPVDVKTPPSDIQGWVRALTWSADGQWLAAAYSDQNASIVVWKM